MRNAVLAIAALFTLAACPQTYAPAPPPNPNPTPTPNPTPDPGTTVSTPGADGATCNVAADCESGICEGQGCGENQGVCAPRSRGCTRDLATYCGCDGQTFQGSGSCPNKRFSKRGPCDGSGTRTSLADGAACSAGSECTSGICEGEGCGELAGTCRPKSRACTMDIRQYCGCDGVTFNASGSCPGKLFAKRGSCDG